MNTTSAEETQETVHGEWLGAPAVLVGLCPPRKFQQDTVLREMTYRPGFGRAMPQAQPESANFPEASRRPQDSKGHPWLSVLLSRDRSSVVWLDLKISELKSKGLHCGNGSHGVKPCPLEASRCQWLLCALHVAFAESRFPCLPEAPSLCRICRTSRTTEGRVWPSMLISSWLLLPLPFSILSCQAGK